MAAVDIHVGQVEVRIGVVRLVDRKEEKEGMDKDLKHNAHGFGTHCGKMQIVFTKAFEP